MKLKSITAILSLSALAYAPLTWAQTCRDNVAESTPTATFEVHNNGTVTHKQTKLMWKVCSEGQTWKADGTCDGTVANYQKDEALTIPLTLNAENGFAGHTDWRLPTVKELKSIVESKCYLPSINAEIFNNTASSGYRSSSTIEGNDISAWGVYFHFGFDYFNSNGNQDHVRLVRDGK